MTQLLKSFQNDDSGATAIEYTLIAALISIVIIASAQTTGTQLSSMFQNIQTSTKH